MYFTFDHLVLAIPMIFAYASGMNFGVVYANWDKIFEACGNRALLHHLLCITNFIKVFPVLELGIYKGLCI